MWRPAPVLSPTAKTKPRQITVVSSESEPHGERHGSHGARIDGQAVLYGTDRGVDRRYVDVVDRVRAVDAEFEAPFVIQPERAEKRSIQGELRDTRNRVPPGIAKSTRSGNDERRRVEEAGAGGHREACRLGPRIARVAGTRRIAIHQCRERRAGGRV